MTQDIPLREIDPNPNQPRKNFDKASLKELAGSIKSVGLIVPILVRPNGERFEIVHGERRYKAVKSLRWQAIPAEVRELNSDEAFVISVTENLQREDMTPLDTAEALRELKQSRDWSNKDIERSGIMSESMVRRYLDLLDQTPKVQRQIKRGKLTPRHVAEVKNLPRAEHEAVLLKAAREGLSTKQTRDVAKCLEYAPGEKARGKILDWSYSSYTHDPKEVKERAGIHGVYDSIWDEVESATQKERKKTAEQDRAVAMWLDAIKAFSAAAYNADAAAEHGRFSPEAIRFTLGWHDSVRKALDKIERRWNGNDQG